MEVDQANVPPGQEQPPPPTPRPDSFRERAKRWVKRELGTIGIGTLFTVGAFVLTDYLWPKEERFHDRVADERAILEDPDASEDARINAARALARLAETPEQAGLVADLLRVFVEGQTRPAPRGDGAADGPCSGDRSEAGGTLARSIPRFVSRAVLSWGEVAAEIGDEAPVRLSGADLRGLEAPDARLRGASFEGACLAGARLEGADLRGAALSDAELTGARAAGADLDGATLRDAVLHDADLAGASLVGARLNGACLARADLTRAELGGAQLAGADLSLALLGDARLRGTDLARASLAGAYLAGTELRGVEYWGEVRDFDTAYLGEAVGLSEAQSRIAQDGGAVVTPRGQREWLEIREEFARRRGAEVGRCR